MIADVVQRRATRGPVRRRRGDRLRRRDAGAGPDRHAGQDRRARRRAQGDAEVGRPRRRRRRRHLHRRPARHRPGRSTIRPMVDFILRRARDIELVHVYPAGAATKGCEGERMAEIGLMHEAGALYFTDVDRPIVDSKVMRRVLTYAGASASWSPTGRPIPGCRQARWPPRASSPAAWACRRRPGHRRAHHAGARPGAGRADRRAAARRPDHHRRRAGEPARGQGQGARRSPPPPRSTTCRFNEIDIGDYRTFYRLDPPLRSEDDRQALIEAVAGGLIDVDRLGPRPRPGRGQAPALRRGRARRGRAGDPAAGPAGPAPRRPRAAARPDPRR